MIVYSNKFKNSSVPFKEMEFEVLNELKNTESRTDDNCLHFTRFLFEMDEIPLDIQEKVYVESCKPICRRITFSGKKSLHFIIELEPEYDNVCKKYYRDIWNLINETYFDSKCDTQCKNPSRLTRRPGAFRKDTKCYQKLIYSADYYISTSIEFKKLLKNMIKNKETIKAVLDLYKQPEVNFEKKNNDGLCRNYDVIVYYLNKRFPNRTGNGDSSISLFKAIRCCLKYNDNLTLEQIIQKAKSELWTDKEIERIISNIKQKYL